MKSEINENIYFINSEGLKLFRLIYQPDIKPIKALIFLCHGLFEHCQASYFETIIQPLNAIGCLVITHDHQGHGKSEGKRGIIDNFQHLVRDVLLDIDDVIKTTDIPSDIPKFLYGHSMGGMISIYASLEKKKYFTGMCLESPAILFPTKVSKLLIWLGKLVSITFPYMSLGKFDYNDICRDPAQVIKIRNDELRIHAGLPAITIISLYNALSDLQDNLSKVDTAFIVGHGEVDEICEIEGSKILMEKAITSDKKLITFPEAKHQLRIEMDGIDKIFSKEIVDWVHSKIAIPIF